jgi:hypothetical protein
LMMRRFDDDTLYEVTTLCGYDNMRIPTILEDTIP